MCYFMFNATGIETVTCWGDVEYSYPFHAYTGCLKGGMTIQWACVYSAPGCGIN